jgi:catechol 2,3-dioxygenase-like lactoylglutathione lyase family enzyme
MTDPQAVRASLLVLYSPRLEECRRFYSGLGLSFTTEQHGNGPAHYAAVLTGGTVFEIYPARPDHPTGALRLGFTVDGTTTTPPLAPGRHLLTDPDGHTVEVHAT